MKILTLFKTTRILNALLKGNKKPLQRLLRKLLKEGPYWNWSQEDILYLKAIASFCLEHCYIQDAQDLIRITGFDMLLELPESTFQVAVDLVENGDEAFAKEAFSALECSVVHNQLSDAESKLLMCAAEKAIALGKDSIALCVYRAALANSALLDSEGTHPLVVAAKSNNHIMGQAYREIYHEHLRYACYACGHLETLVQCGDPYFLQIALECEANVHAPTTTGESLLDIAPNTEVRKLLMQHGARPTDRRIYLLRQGILSIENSCEVNHEVMREIFADSDPLLCYSFYESTHPTVSNIKWDLMYTAAKYRSVPALRYMLPYLQNHCTDQLLSKIIRAILGADKLAITRDAQNAKAIIAVLELLESSGVSFDNPWDWSNEKFRMTADYNSKVAQALDFACNSYRGDSECPDEDFIKMTMLLWRVGGIYGTPEGARELLLLGINCRKKCLLEACLAEFDCSCSLLDTNQTSAAWNVVASQHGQENTIREILDFVISNGADINHQNADGLTALHAAHQYGRTMNFSPVKLLIAAGADPSIRDRFGRRPKDMPQEKFVFISGGSAWSK